MSKFRINKDSGAGFFMEFNNGYTVSVQWRSGLECDNGKTTAECAVGSPDGSFIDLQNSPLKINDCIAETLTPEDVLTLMNWVASL